MTAYPELSEEMKKRNIKQKDMAQALNLSDRGLYNKLHGLSEFTKEEVRIIREAFFPELSMDCLFPVPAPRINDGEPEVRPETPEVRAALPERESEPEPVIPERKPEVRVIQSVIPPEVYSKTGNRNRKTGNKTGMEIGNAGRKWGKNRIGKRKFRILHNRDLGMWHIGVHFCIRNKYSAEKRETYLFVCFGQHDFYIGLLFPHT